MYDILMSVLITADSLSMLPRLQDGIVELELIVYEFYNIRVADLRTISLRVAARARGLQVSTYDCIHNFIRNLVFDICCIRNRRASSRIITSERSE